MKVLKYMGHLTVIVLCCLLTVLAETLDTRDLQNHPMKHLNQQLQQQQQQQPHHQRHHQHQRQHLAKLRQHLLTNAADSNTARQSRKLDMKSLHHPNLHNNNHNNQLQHGQENPNTQVELIENLKNTLRKNAINATKTTTTTTNASSIPSTKLRRLVAKDYYNKSMQRRYNSRRNAEDEWAYKTYNVQTNTFESDDNSDDVEFISSAGVNEVPTTESPAETVENSRLHICVQHRTITMPVKRNEVTTRPIWKYISEPCVPQTQMNMMCTRVQLVEEKVFRDVTRNISVVKDTYDCCTGWMRESPQAEGCMKPICAARCQNGGSCTGPDTCSCPLGFNGRYCERDINECKEQKPCDQTCYNTVGSYYCKCREGFTLQVDKQSCKKHALHRNDAFEARDLEEIETQEDITDKLHKIEKQLANERVQVNEMRKVIGSTYTMVDLLKNRLVNLEKQQLDYNRLQTNLYNTQYRFLNLETRFNQLMRCRNGPNAHCP